MSVVKEIRKDVNTSSLVSLALKNGKKNGIKSNNSFHQ